LTRRRRRRSISSGPRTLTRLELADAGFRSLPSTIGFFASQTFHEKSGHTVGGASAHLLAFYGSSFREKGLPREQAFHLLVGDGANINFLPLLAAVIVNVLPLWSRRPSSRRRPWLGTATYDLAFYCRARPEAPPKRPPNLLSEGQANGVFPRESGGSSDCIKRDVQSLYVGNSKQGDHPGGERIGADDEYVGKGHRRRPIEAAQLKYT
jgi:hypothetical protein